MERHLLQQGGMGWDTEGTGPQSLYKQGEGENESRKTTRENYVIYIPQSCVINEY